MRLLFFILACLLGTIATPAIAADDPVYTSWRNNIAVGGYDTVSFFSGKPVEGLEEFETTYLGAQWRFASRANLDLFKTNPTAFAPQYGGYCAWATAHGKLAKGSPKYWHLRDGRLYLNFNARIQEKWEEDIPGFVAKASEAWPELLED